MERPATVFKYHSTSDYSLESLKTSSIYFASPTKFNDPYDCALIASIADTSDEDLRRLRDECISNDVYPKAVRDRIPGMSLRQFEESIREGALKWLHGERERFLRENGVACFSSTNDDLLMWSHYAGSHRGFCLEFRTNYKPFDLLQPVSYVSEMPQFLLDDFVRNQNHQRLLDLYRTKFAAWAYEKEWRILHKQAGTCYRYRSESLKAVYFGAEMEAADRASLCRILENTFPAAEIWIGVRAASTYRVQFRLDYSPFRTL